LPSIQAQAASEPRSLLRTRLGALTLLLLCGVQFLDVVDSSITNVAFPSIQHALHFSQQNLQWVASGYLLTYGGFLLLGGRLADLLGRRRVLVAGLVGFAACSLAAELAQSQGILIAARLLQGVGAAMMAPAALSILTTTFREGADRNTALGVWGAISGLGAAAGVFLGGVLSEGPGWRWASFVNIPLCLLALGASVALLTGERKRAALADFDAPGALLGTGGMLLVYALIKAPARLLDDGGIARSGPPGARGIRGREGGSRPATNNRQHAPSVDRRLCGLRRAGRLPARLLRSAQHSLTGRLRDRRNRPVAIAPARREPPPQPRVVAQAPGQLTRSGHGARTRLPSMKAQATCTVRSSACTRSVPKRRRGRGLRR
jgi:hypothetical protein